MKTILSVLRTLHLKRKTGKNRNVSID
jgi:hypothetical protein